MTKRRVLIIAYYFPPSGGSGVQRALKFVKYLPAFGWEPVVLTVDPQSAAYPDLDPEMESDIPDGIQVHRTDSWDPYRIYAGFTNKTKESAVSVGFLSDKPITVREKVARWIRANLFIPDARVGWYFYAIKQAQALVASGEIDAVFTTGPPHSTHLIGRAVQRKHNLPWIADFRDPWVDIDFLDELPMSSFARQRNEKFEKSVLDESSTVLTISPQMQEAFEQKTETPCVTVYNGYDDTDFQQNITASDNHFVIAHVGNMNAARNPQALWKAIADARKDGALSKLKIKLVGNVDGEVNQMLSRFSLETLTDRIEYCPHSEAVAEMKRSNMLMLPINNVFSARGIITGKIFEYMAAGRSILGIGPIDGEAARVLNETNTGQMFDFEDQAGIQSYLMDHYRAWENHQVEYSPQPEAVALYSRKGQTGVLAEVLNKLCVED